MAGELQEFVEVFQTGGNPPTELIHVRFTQHAFPRHYHDTYLIQVVTRGVDCFLCGHEQLQAGVGTVVFIHPGEVHTGAVLSDEPLEYRALYPSIELMERLAADLELDRSPEFEQGVVEDPLLAEAVVHAHERAEDHPGPASDKAIEEVLQAAIARHGCGVRKHGERLLPKPIRAILQLIEEDPGRNFSLDEFSEYTSFSPFYLTRLFTKSTGMPPHEFLLAYRAERARELLRKGVSAGQAAADLGFADQAHFTRSFRKVAGGTPGVFLKRPAQDIH